MTDKSRVDLIREIQQELYQVAGVSVQVYSEDLIIQRLKDALDNFYNDPDIKWKRYLDYRTYTLSGVDGYTTTPVSANFADYGDIIEIWPSDSEAPLVKWSTQRNPLLITGDRPVQYKAGSTDTIQVIPLTATGQIVVYGRVRPTFPTTNAGLVPFDGLALKYYVAWQMLVDDGSNGASAERLRLQFEDRWKMLKFRDQQEPIALNGRGSSIPNEWREYP